MKNTTNKELIKKSKFISFVLRHGANEANLDIDIAGYVSVPDLISIMQKEFEEFSFSQLENIVSTDDKGRYSFNSDKTKIRANQGHSLDEVKISFEQATPKGELYHGTTKEAWESIKTSEIKAGERHFVHLTESLDVAVRNAKRWNKTPVVLEVNWREMQKDGFVIYKSENDVFLVERVPSKYLKERSIV